MGVAVGVLVGVRLVVGVIVASGVAVAGVSVPVGVSDGVGVAVAGVRVPVGVSDGVGVAVAGVRVPVGVFDGVGVGVSGPPGVGVSRVTQFTVMCVKSGWIERLPGVFTTVPFADSSKSSIRVDVVTAEQVNWNTASVDAS